ncbi:hypothetical protein B0H13DRAFT_1935266 [Mycena leptocephala]|nr:hypothetical protein B0H13DRAFT_1935266 [Mycena leptocephala]
MCRHGVYQIVKQTFTAVKDPSLAAVQACLFVPGMVYGILSFRRNCVIDTSVGFDGADLFVDVTTDHTVYISNDGLQYIDQLLNMQDNPMGQWLGEKQIFFWAKPCIVKDWGARLTTSNVITVGKSSTQKAPSPNTCFVVETVAGLFSALSAASSIIS